MSEGGSRGLSPRRQYLNDRISGHNQGYAAQVRKPAQEPWVIVVLVVPVDFEFLKQQLLQLSDGLRDR